MRRLAFLALPALLLSCAHRPAGTTRPAEPSGARLAWEVLDQGRLLVGIPAGWTATIGEADPPLPPTLRLEPPAGRHLLLLTPIQDPGEPAGPGASAETARALVELARRKAAESAVEAALPLLELGGGAIGWYFAATDRDLAAPGRSPGPDEYRCLVQGVALVDGLLLTFTLLDDGDGPHRAAALEIVRAARHEPPAAGGEEVRAAPAGRPAGPPAPGPDPAAAPSRAAGPAGRPAGTGAASASPPGAPPPPPRPDRPLGVDTPGALRALVLDLPLEDARPAGASLDARWTLANDWSIPTRLTRQGRTVLVQLDDQSDRLALSLHLPWSRLLGDGPLAGRLATTLDWQLLARWGGYTDGAIEAWHALGKYSRFQRPDHPRDAVALHLAEVGGATLVDLTRPRVAAGDAAVRTSLRLVEGERLGLPWAAALRLDLKVPIGAPSALAGSGGLDAGLGLGGSLPLLPWLTGHAQLAARRVSALPGSLPLRLRDWQLGAEASLVAWRGDLALLLESRWLSALFERGWRVVGEPRQGDALTAVTRTQNQITVGLRWRAVTFWFSEDWTPGARPEVAWIWFYDTNAPDVALGLSAALPF